MRLVIPRMLDSIGVNSYNVGIATAGISFYEIIINDYLLNFNNPPQNIFIYLGPITFSSKSDNYIKYPIHRYLDNPISNIEVVLNYKLYENSSFKNYKNYFLTMTNKLHDAHSLYFKSFNKGLKNLYNLRNNSDVDDSNLIEILNKGYSPSFKVATDSTLSSDKENYTSLKFENFNFNKLDKLYEIVELLEMKNISVKFFELPTFGLNDLFNEEYISDYENSIKKIAETYKVISYNKLLFNIKHFRDIVHLNHFGAKIATKEIINFLLIQ